ncbi:unnamed protein product [Spirodela intermedia]|uniref:Uncharacterized protein n=1 Tax=Spirodela intermedia TaxID=51605 RepID=A0ABN7ECY1_SPIIN|nr:unnamed protein product [Spirodela intermedia]
MEGKWHTHAPIYPSHSSPYSRLLPTTLSTCLWAWLTGGSPSFCLSFIFLFLFHHLSQK